MNKIIIIPIVAIVFFLIDLYVFNGIKSLMANFAPVTKKAITYIYWGIFIFTIVAFFVYHFGNPDKVGRLTRNFIMVWIFVNYFSKFFAALFLIIDDLGRAFRWMAQFFSNPRQTISEGPGISRSDFLVKTAVVAAAVPFTAMAYGILSGAHDYRIRRKIIYLPNLHAAFDGIKIGQLSDIHTGSFFNRTAVKGGVEMLMKEKPDLVFFTGDLVNNESSEVKDYVNIFEKVSAPLGVYSTLGNHDYGDYISWPSTEAKTRNIQKLMDAHKQMGWDLLMNENRPIELNKERISIIGVENWGAGRFAKYGDLAKAYKGSEESAVKLLLSHDPSHWDAQIRPQFSDIDITFSGHTHGFQFGVELGDLKWSPSQYIYEQWAGLYQKQSQYLYVNRGFGYLGFPGRIGIPPEITIVELKRA